MALPGQLSTPEIGQPVKVHLPGESPYAECLAFHGDGTWEGKIINLLFGEMKDSDRAAFTDEHFGFHQKPLPRLHHYRQGQIVRFRKETTKDYEIWVPSEQPPGSA